MRRSVKIAGIKLGVFQKHIDKDDTISGSWLTASKKYGTYQEEPGFMQKKREHEMIRAHKGLLSTTFESFRTLVEYPDGKWLLPKGKGS